MKPADRSHGAARIVEIAESEGAESRAPSPCTRRRYALKDTRLITRDLYVVYQSPGEHASSDSMP